MKDRARRFGESGANKLILAMQQAAAGKDVNVHLMGHSFGCIVVSAMLAGVPNAPASGVKVKSIVLVQGALSLWSFCAEIPKKEGTPGYFNRLLKAGQVTGPIVTTQSEFDSAVGTFYPLAAGLKRQVSFDLDEIQFPKYGGVGSFGVQGLSDITTSRKMGDVSEDYAFQPGKIYNLEGSQYIHTGPPPSGAHSDIVHPQIAHVIWQAARV
jgi:pimeloyl-ACP methyl ester carboxylesterase